MLVNIHPVFVHFPVALLTVYAVFEMLRFRKLLQNQTWFYIKAIFVILGTGAALFAIITGNMAKHFQEVAQTVDFRGVVGLHQSYAKLTSVIFGILAAGYAIRWLEMVDFQRFLKYNWLKKLWSLGKIIAKVLTDTNFAWILAVLGLVALTVTGALGGYMVYGDRSDPMIHLVAKYILRR